MSATSEVPAAFRNAAGERGPVRLVLEGFNDIRSRQRLVRYLVQADIHKRGADTLLGNIWWVLDPLLQMVVYVVFLSIIVSNRPEDYPLFVFAAILPWKWFSTVVSDAITSVSGQERLIKQIQFPKIVLPAAAMIAGIAQFLFGLIPLFAMLFIFYTDRVSLALLYIPVVAVVQFVFTLAFGLIVAALNVFFRDVGNLARHVLRLWFYLSPALWGADTILSLSEKHPTIFALIRLNPFFTILESYRDAVYYGRTPDLIGLAVVLVGSLALLILGTIFFKRLEPAFAKVL